jgi:hypothetical protein
MRIVKLFGQFPQEPLHLRMWSLTRYKPEEAPDFKWRNTCPGHYIQGLKQMNDRKSNNDTLIITKSLKDVMVFYEFMTDTMSSCTAKLIFLQRPF